MVSKQGQKAANKGREFEELIQSQLTQAGVNFEKQVRLVGGSLFGEVKVIDLLITNHPEYPDGLYAEIKWQGSGGTTDEKIPYAVACIKELYDKPCVLIFDGKGFRKGVLPWLMTQVGGNLVKVIHGDLSQWLMDTDFN